VLPEREGCAEPAELVDERVDGIVAEEEERLAPGSR